MICIKQSTLPKNTANCTANANEETLLVFVICVLKC